MGVAAVAVAACVGASGGREGWVLEFWGDLGGGEGRGRGRGRTISRQTIGRRIVPGGLRRRRLGTGPEGGKMGGRLRR